MVKYLYDFQLRSHVNWGFSVQVNIRLKHIIVLLLCSLIFALNYLILITDDKLLIIKFQFWTDKLILKYVFKQIN